MKKLLGLSWDVKIGAILATLGSVIEYMNENGFLENTKWGKYIAAAGVIIAMFRSKSSAVTGTGKGAARMPDVNNIPIPQNPN